MEALFKFSYEQTLQAGFYTVTLRGLFDVHFRVGRVDPVNQPDQFKGRNQRLSPEDFIRIKRGSLFHLFLSYASHVCTWVERFPAEKRDQQKENT